MATGFLHHIGTFFLLVAVALLIVTDVTSPVVAKLPIARTTLSNSTNIHDTSVAFGTFGYCVVNAVDGNNYCSGTSVGYRPMQVLRAAEGTSFNVVEDDSTYGLTKVMILHPIATAVVFIAFLLSLGASVVGSLLAACVAFLSFLITAAAVISDFVLFSIVMNAVRDANTGATSNYSHGAWTILVAGILTLLGSVILFFTCCSARMHRRRNPTVKQPVVSDYGAPVARPKRRWGFGRKGRY